MIIQPDRRITAPQNNYYPMPFVIERSGNREQSYDIYSRLLKDRIIFLGTAIDDHVANAVIAQLLFLQMDDGKKDVSIYINSPGGSVTAGLAIYDTMQFMTCDGEHVLHRHGGERWGRSCSRPARRANVTRCRIPTS